MKALRSLCLVSLVLTVVCGATFAQNASPQPDAARAILQAKTVYVLTGHVRYYKTKALFKKELVDETPFEEPARKELEKWGRFTLLPEAKGADLVIRVYEKGNTQYVPVSGPGVTGSVNVGSSFFILDIWQPSSKKIIWSASKNVGTSWSTNTGVANLVKKLREYIDEQEKSAPKPNDVPAASLVSPQK